VVSAGAQQEKEEPSLEEGRVSRLRKRTKMFIYNVRVSIEEDIPGWSPLSEYRSGRPMLEELRIRQPEQHVTSSWADGAGTPPTCHANKYDPRDTFVTLAV
jgi:hypothetical protein